MAPWDRVVLARGPHNMGAKGSGRWPWSTRKGRDNLASPLSAFTCPVCGLIVPDDPRSWFTNVTLGIRFPVHRKHKHLLTEAMVRARAVKGVLP